MAFDFSNKSVAVTGTSGIGLDAALTLARYGAHVFLGGVDPALNDTAHAAATEAGLDIHISQVDVSDEASVERWAKVIGEEAEALHGLVNAAGIQTYGTVETTAPSDWDRTMAVNLRSCYLTAHFLYPFLKAAQGAAILHVASVQGHANQNGVLAYATTKGAIHTLTRAMAVDCAKDSIRVNSISPGSVRTPLLEYSASQLATDGKSIEDMIEVFGQAHPIGRVGQVSDISAMIAYLCSDMAGFVTGADFLIDGGLKAHLGV